MNNEKACYWVALGVLALGLGNSLAARHPDWIHCISMHAVETADQLSSQICDRISGRTSDLGERVALAVDRSQAGIERAQAAASRVQGRMECIQAKMAQKQAQLDRIQSGTDRIQAQFGRAMARAQAHRVVIIPQPNFDVESPGLPILPDGGTI